MIRQFALPAALVALAVSAPLAQAEEASGVVMAVDVASQTLTLEDGTVFQLPAGWNDPAVVPGALVAVTYETEGDVHMASAVEVSN
ncbi:MAG: DUF1344 domain-containing protein [Alphaproteobacteria bacterium]